MKNYWKERCDLAEEYISMLEDADFTQCKDIDEASKAWRLKRNETEPYTQFGVIKYVHGPGARAPVLSIVVARDGTPRIFGDFEEAWDIVRELMGQIRGAGYTAEPIDRPIYAKLLEKHLADSRK